MVHTGQVAAATASRQDMKRVPASVAAEPATPTTPTTSRPGRSRVPFYRSTSSFRAGSPPLNLMASGSLSRAGVRRLPSQVNSYQTFPTAPPRTPGHRASHSSSTPSFPGGGDDDAAAHHEPTPLPWRQLLLLALLSLSEQTALNSISPYLPTMVGSFAEIDEQKVGLYVGLLASAFAMAQLTTNLFWGYLSDVVGRKPVMLLGTTLLCACFAVFGFCTRYWHAIVVHVAMGLLNGNAAVVPTCLGELTDRSNQSRAFTWLPVVYSLGSITGPALGGLLVGKLDGAAYPFLAPNVLGASLLALSVVVLAIWYEETLEDRADPAEWPASLRWLLCCLKRTKGKVLRQGGRRASGGEHAGDEQQGLLTSAPGEGERRDSADDGKGPSDPATWKQLWNRTTILVLVTYLIFQVSNISFSSLYPLFASGPPPTGRDLRAGVIGVSLSVAGIFTILFQLFLYPMLKAKLGNLGTYRISLVGFVVSMALMPFVGYRDSPPPFGVGNSTLWLYFEMGAVLVIKNICAVGGLSSVMLLVSVTPRPQAVPLWQRTLD